MTRNVADLVKKEHFVLDSEYLVTMLVVVPLASINDWNNRYEKLTDMIVPRSSQLIYQVQEHKATRAVNELSRSFTLLLAFSESRIYQDLRHNARQALSKRKQKALVGIGAISGHCETARSFVYSSTNCHRSQLLIESPSLVQDNDHALVSITCFKKVADEFKQRARENKFVVRDFAYDEEQLKSG